MIAIRKVKKRWIIIVCILLLILFVTEKRSFYCLENGKCVTVWKTFYNICYVTPYKYYGLLFPHDNYFKTERWPDADISIYWSGDFPNEVFFEFAPDHALIQLVNKSPEKLKFTDIYFNQEEYRKKILEDKSGKRVSPIKDVYRTILLQDPTNYSAGVKDNVSVIRLDIANDRLNSKKKAAKTNQ